MARWRGWLVLAAIVLVTAGFAQTGAGRGLLRAAGVIAPPSGYTELTFARLGDLPTQVVSRAKFNVSFVIHNATSVAHDYQWSVWLIHNGGAHYMAKGSTTIAPGRVTTVAHAVTVACSTGRASIVVRLASPAESIDFWTRCLPRTGGLS